MTFEVASSVRLVFVVAVAMTFVMQISPLLFTGFGESSHRVLPESFIDIPTRADTLMKQVVSKYSTSTRYIANTTNHRLFTSTATSRAITSNGTNVSTVVSYPRLGPIFYNIFIPSDRQHSTLKIIKEQIQERDQTDPSAHISYTLIGSSDVDESIQQMCQPNCTQRTYLAVGNEVDTLQALWEYCKDHPHYIVTYIHDKGSFHPSRANKKAQRVGTKAALACRGLLLDYHSNVVSNPHNEATKKRKVKSRCNICSYRFYSFPVYHTRANMWSAQCSYLRNLLPPRDYESAVRDMYQQTVNHSTLGPTRFACLRPHEQSDRFLGLGRYAMERWALNHPTVEPCDGVSKTEVRNLKKKRKSPENFVPKLTVSPQRRAVTSGIQSMITSWERLAGRLFEWNYLYHRKPDKASWVWKYYRGFENGNSEFINSCTTFNEEAVHTMM